MRKSIYIFLICGMLLSTVACGGGSEDKDRETNSRSSKSEQSSEAVVSSDNSKPTEEEELTLENAEVRLVYSGGGVLAVAFHGPEDIGMTFCNKDGSPLEEELFLGYGEPSPNWTLGITYEMTDQYSADNLALKVSDYQAERDADGRYATKVYEFGELMSDDELADIGFNFLDGRCCIVSRGRGTYGRDNFGLTFNISWFCDGYDQETDTIDIQSFADKFEFFVDNGIPLEEAFEGYQMEVSIQGDAFFQILLYQSGEENNEEKHHQLADEMKDHKPYLVYTNDDSSALEIPLM